MSSFVSNLVAQLTSGNKVTVGVSISLNVGLEMAVIDHSTRRISKYANRPLTYNQLTREVDDYNSLKIALKELFDELDLLPQKTNVILNLPNVLFGHTYLPVSLDDESVMTALTSVAEDNYLFKKNTPSISWVEVSSNNRSENRYILYSVIQEAIVYNLKEVFDDLGANLTIVENTNSSIIKTLEYTGIAKQLIDGSPDWNILLVSQNSYAVFSMQGYNIIEYFEDPLAIKSFSGDEVYTAIAQAAGATLSKYPIDKLLVISETNDVSAEKLALKIKDKSNIIFLECNKFAKQPIINTADTVMPEYLKAMTPEVVGAAIYNTQNFSLKLNLLNKAMLAPIDGVVINILGTDIELSQNQLMIWSLIIAAVLLFGCFAISSVLKTANGVISSENEKIEQEIIVLKAKVDQLQRAKNAVSIYDAAKMIDENNKNASLYFDAIGTEIPTKVWLTRFFSEQNGSVAVEGETVSVDDLYLFYRSLKSVLPNAGLILSNLKVDDNGGVIDIRESTNVVYTFTMTNKAYAVAQAKAAAALMEAQQAAEGAPPVEALPGAP